MRENGPRRTLRGRSVYCGVFSLFLVIFLYEPEHSLQRLHSD